PALGRGIAADHQRPPRLHRVDVLAPRHELRGPQAEVDAAAQPFRPADLPVAVEVAKRLRDVALASQLYGPQAAEEEEEDGSADDDQRQQARLQFSTR